MINVIAMLLDRLVARLGADDRGEVSIEYVLVGGLMAVAIVAGIVGLTSGLSGWFTGIGTEIGEHLPG
jgi:Flp pilus assembly pilin Flp